MRKRWSWTAVVTLAWALSSPVASLGADEIVGGRSIDAWVRVLRDRRSSERGVALESLYKVGASDPRVVPALAAATSDPEWGPWAIQLLGRLGKDARQAAPTLKALMWQNSDPAVRMLAAEVLWQIANEPECVDAVVPCLDHPEMELRARAVEVLGNIGPPAKKATPKLLRLLGDQVYVRITSVEALGRIHSEPQATVPALGKALRDPWPLVRSNAAIALAAFGDEATDAIPALERAMADDDATVRVEAANALWCVGKRPNALRRLCSAATRFGFETEDASYIALDHLTEIGRDNEEVAPRLIELLNQGHRHKVEIAMSLWNLDRRPEALAALSAALEDERFATRRAAAESLKTLGPEAKSVVPALLKALARAPDQEQLVPRGGVDDPPAIVEPNTRGHFERCRLAAWTALQKIDPAASARYRSEHPSEFGRRRETPSPSGRGPG